MRSNKGYYSVIQYCPDFSRLEAANIGVLLFCPELAFIKAQTSHGNDRIRRFFGSEDNDWIQINALKASIEERVKIEAPTIRTLGDLDRFISTRANAVQLTPPRPMRVEQPERELEELFRRLVGGRSRKDQAKATARRRLEREFERAGVSGRLRRDVIVPVPAFRRSVTVPFGYQNSRFRLIQPTVFQGATSGVVLNQACRYAVSGRSLYEHPDQQLGELQLVVVGDFSAEQEREQEMVKEILQENRVDFYSAVDVNKLIEDIRRSHSLTDS